MLVHPGSLLQFHGWNDLFQTHYQVNLLDSELSYSKVSVEIRGPDNKTYLEKRLNNNNGRGSFVPSKIGMHELVVKYEGHEVLAGDVFYTFLSVSNWFGFCRTLFPSFTATGRGGATWNGALRSWFFSPGSG